MGIESNNIRHETAFSSQLVAIIGLGHGDEGKGRVIPDAHRFIQRHRPDQSVAMVLKVNGGSNSGHTVAGLKHNLIPGGVTCKEIETLALSSGVVADPIKLIWEIRPLIEAGYNVGSERLKIDTLTMVSHVMDRIIDGAQEAARENKGQPKRGSTMRGISPAYSRETGMQRINFDVFLGSKDEFRQTISEHIDYCCAMAQSVYKISSEQWFGILDLLTKAEQRANAASIEAGYFLESEFDFRSFAEDRPFALNLEAVSNAYWKAGEALIPNIRNVRRLPADYKKKGRSILGEFGHAARLDLRYGFTPNVTASRTWPFEMYSALAIPKQYGLHVIGVTKAYETAVGTHVFPTRIDVTHPLGAILSTLEFGTTTGRQRMVGWADAVMTGHSVQHAGCDDITINKLDALTLKDNWCGPLKICTAYKDRKGKIHHTLPDSEKTYHDWEPVYVDLPGWTKDISGITKFSELEIEAQRYVATLYKAIVLNAYYGREIDGHLPILRFIGTGPNPGEIIEDAPSPERLMEMGTDVSS